MVEIPEVIDPMAGIEGRKRTALEIRADATQATLERFRDRPFKFGSCDCAQIVKFQCRQLGRPLTYGKALTYRTATSAVAVLRKLGFESMEAAMDAEFARIAAASALPGDILQMPGEHDDRAGGLAAMVVYLGNGAVLGFHADAVGAVVMRIKEAPLAGWRII